jgi:hypothetical protein
MARRVSFAAAFSLSFLVAAPGCPSRDLSELPSIPAKEQGHVVHAERRGLDILFVIDDSGSMAANQERLIANFPLFMEELAKVEGGLPDVHIGVVSSDLGAARNPGDPYLVSNCQGRGKEGMLQSAPRVPGCAPPDGAFIVDVADESGGRSRNYSGSLGETFDCIARLGTLGCGFEQHLEAMRQALDGRNPGFLRDGAYLAVIFVADEDDCSVFPTPDGYRMFDDQQRDVADELGALASYRCTEYGIECVPDSREQLGPRSDCRPREASPFMPHPREYVEFLYGLKEDPGLIVAAGILGPPAPVAVEEHPLTGDPRLAVSCKDPPDCDFTTGSDTNCQAAADPAVRLGWFLGQFGQNVFTSICDVDLSAAMVEIGKLVREVVDNRCLRGELVLDASGAPRCTVEDVRFRGTDREERGPAIPRCSSPAAAPSEAPCWYVEQDPQCSGYPTGLAIEIERGSEPAPPGTSAEVRCEAR